jgi:putative phosphoserine phosphatase/1-acylglycerol-3-phosphate O-acyltransferase
MATEAAIFDLDRTLLAGASGPAISAALRRVQLLADRTLPGEDLLFRVFNLVGENRPSMMLTRQGVRLAKGWAQDRARQAGEIAAKTLLPMVQPYARVLIEEHHAAGRRVVVATTTPIDMVQPFADQLGLDGVIATRYDTAHGKYTGGLDGEFVWGKGKLRAVQEWANDNDVDLEASWAYSDSWFDIPLLSAVGHPVAVKPDPRLRAYAMLRRWPVQYLDVPPGVPKFLGIEPQQAIFPFARTQLVPYARIEIEDVENIPAVGPAIICGNHRSYFDPLAIGYAVAKRGRPVRFLGKKEVFDAPIVGDMARAMGGIRVERGTGSDEPLKEAAAALKAGELVVILPQGTIPRGEAFFDPVLKGRWGAARLAEMTHAPIVPLGLWGTEKVWPRSERLPRMLNVTHPPRVMVRLGEAIELKGADPDDDTARIMDAVVDLLPSEAREHHVPTPEELALTMPSSHQRDAVASTDHEEARRPGTD